MLGINLVYYLSGAETFRQQSRDLFQFCFFQNQSSQQLAFLISFAVYSDDALEFCDGQRSERPVEVIRLEITHFFSLSNLSEACPVFLSEKTEKRT